MNKYLRASLALLLTSTMLPAVAGEQEMRPYLSGGVAYTFADSDRNSNGGQGLFLGAGKTINQFWGLEFGGFYNGFDSGTGSPAEWRELGAKLDGLFFYSREAAFSPYFGVGVGGVKTDLKTAPTGSSTDAFVDAGLGFFKYFAANGGVDLGMRADLRYRWVDADELPTAVNSSFSEPVLRLSLVVPMGARATSLEPTAAATAASPTGSRIAAGKVVPNDNDGDGVLDDTDNCPGTPGGWLIDARGCPVDSDHDGVPDNLDKCPGTAAGITVDAKGCPVAAAVAGAGRSFENVNFAFDKADLTDYAKALLDNAANVIGGLVQKYPSLKIDVSGHTDWMGTDAYNQALSERRANAVKDYLTRKGVDPARVSSFAYGETKPVAPNDTEEGRALNRRAEVRTHE